MKRLIVTVGTDRYARGVERLKRLAVDPVMSWTSALPGGSMPHQRMPYHFKAVALRKARESGAELLRWLDSSVNPVRPLDPLWKLIEEQGYWLSENWWPNGEWCSDASLPLLGVTREETWNQMHVIAGAMGINLKSEIGNRFLDEYIRLSENGSFRGPWKNDHGEASTDPRVRGHRHDQSAASVIAARLGMALTKPPAWIAYMDHGGPDTVLSIDNRGY
jgi:hypothetical protein